MDTKMLDLLEKSPYIFLIVVMIVAIGILWRTINKKDAKVYDLADSVIRVASIYEKNINLVEIQNKEHNDQHEKIIDLLKESNLMDILRDIKHVVEDVQRILKK